MNGGQDNFLLGALQAFFDWDLEFFDDFLFYQPWVKEFCPR